MTQYRNDPDAISNYFDRLLAGAGSRGSSFIDIDRYNVAAPPLWMSHTFDGDRFLFQEFKRNGEAMRRGQYLALEALARAGGSISVWVVYQLTGGMIGWCDAAVSFEPELISEQEYRDRYAAWWRRPK